MANETCGTCRFFILTNGVKGECRRYPPSDRLKGIDLIRLIFSWYLVVKEDTPACGEYKPIEV